MFLPSAMMPLIVDGLEQHFNVHRGWQGESLEAQLAEEMGKVTGRLQMPPGFKLPF